MIGLQEGLADVARDWGDIMNHPTPSCGSLSHRGGRRRPAHHDSHGCLRGERNVRKSQTAPHTRWRWVLIGLVILASALVLAATACGGDNGGNDKSGADASATQAEGTPGASQMSEEVSKKLRDLAEEWAKTSVKATFTYAMIDTDTTKSPVTLYWAPPKVRMDVSDETEGINVILISTPDKTYVCSQERGDQCLAYPPSSDVGNIDSFLSSWDPGAIEAELSGLTGNVQIASSSEKVAGNDASCVSAEGNIGEQLSFIKFCFATNGLLLFESWADAAGTSEWTLQATDIGTVSDSDFEPPYPVSEAVESLYVTMEEKLEEARAQGFALYWVGERYVADADRSGLVLRDLGVTQSVPWRVWLSYSLEGEWIDSVTIYEGPGSWSPKAADGPSGYSRRDVVVQGVTGVLHISDAALDPTFPSQVPTFPWLSLVLSLGGTTIELATAPAVKDGQDMNAFNNPEALLSLAEALVVAE